MATKEDPRRPTEDGKRNIDSIHFEFWIDDISDEQKRLYARKLTYNLLVCGMPLPELLVNQQAALWDVMQMEFQYLELGDVIAACNAECANTIALINNVPCILHLENRTGLKIFGTVIQRGLSKALGKVLFADINDEGH